MSPLTTTVLEKATKLLSKVTNWIIPRLRKGSHPRVRRLIGLPDVDIVRCLHARAMLAHFRAVRDEALEEGDSPHLQLLINNLQSAAEVAQLPKSLGDPV